MNIALLNTSCLRTNDVMSFIMRVFRYMRTKKIDYVWYFGIESCIPNSQDTLFLPIRATKAKTPLFEQPRHYYNRYRGVVPNCNPGDPIKLSNPISEHIKGSGTNVSCQRKTTNVQPLTAQYVGDFFTRISTADMPDIHKLAHLSQLAILNSPEGEQEWIKSEFDCPLNKLIQYYLFVDLMFLCSAKTGREGIIHKGEYSLDFENYQEWEKENCNGTLFIRYDSDPETALKLSRVKEIRECMESMIDFHNENIDRSYVWAAARNNMRTFGHKTETLDQVNACVAQFKNILHENVESSLKNVLDKFNALLSKHKGIGGFVYSDVVFAQ